MRGVDVSLNTKFELANFGPGV